MTLPTPSGPPPPKAKWISRWKWVICGVAAPCLAGCCLLGGCLFQSIPEEGWAASASSLQKIGLALWLYHEIHGRLPPAVVYGKEGQPLYSWRVLLLSSYLDGGDDIYKRFKLDEPWDSPKPLAKKTPKCYRPGVNGKSPPAGLTYYQVVVGPGTAFEHEGLTWADFSDGPTNTILLVEAAEPVPWSQPSDLPYSPVQPLPLLGAGYSKPISLFCYQIGSRQGFNACFADGTVRFIPSDTDEQTIRALITRNGGEKVDASTLR